MMQSTWKTAALTILATIALAVAVGLVTIYSGVIDVAATSPHNALTKWMLETTLEHSMERRARHISLPPPENHPAHHAVNHFHEMCEFCHGAPGKYPTEIGKGMLPEPPDLSEVARKTPDAELFWVVKNGIRMTGMPAFGVTHNDKELWEIVSLVKNSSKDAGGGIPPGSRKY